MEPQVKMPGWGQWHLPGPVLQDHRDRLKTPPTGGESQLQGQHLECGDEEVQDSHGHQDPERSRVLNGHRKEM